MKRIIALSLSAILTVLLCSCAATSDAPATPTLTDTVPVSAEPADTILDKTSVTLEAGMGVTEKLSLSADNTTDKITDWASSDTAVAKVRGGIITAIAAGEAIITATTDSGATGECVVTVTAPNITPLSDGSHRIRIDGTKFVVGPDALPIWMNGTNTPWRVNRDENGERTDDGWDEFGGGKPFEPQWWDEHFAALHENGVNSSRIWFVCSGDYGVNFEWDGYCSGVDPLFWDNVSELFKIAEKHGIYVMATLSSFDCFKNESGPVWQAMIKDDDKIDSYVENYVIPFVNRYGSSDYLWSIDFCNEIDWVVEEQQVATWDEVTNFTARCSKGVHKENPDILTTIGMASTKYVVEEQFPGADGFVSADSGAYEGNMLSDERLQAAVDADKELTKLDFWSTHYYEWECPWFGNPFQYTPAGYGLGGGKPALIAETASVGSGWSKMYANEETGWQSKPSEGAAIQTLTDDYLKAYEMDWAGVLPWTSNGVDGCGGFDDLIPATNKMQELYPDLVFPIK